MSTLHVTNGDSAVDALRAAGFEGEFLPWRDVLHDGPVPADQDMDELAQTRADFIGRAGWGTPSAALRSFRERDRSLAGERERTAILWFEHDLYDQLQLIQILSRLRGAEGRHVDLVCENRYVSEQAPEDLRAMHERRVRVTAAHVEPAIEAWRAFRAPDPSLLERAAGSPVATLPFLAPALYRQLEEYPDVESGLGRSERQILSCLSDSEEHDEDTMTGAELFLATQRRETARFMGDWSFWMRLAGLATGDMPFVRVAGEPPSPVPSREAFLLPVRLTQTGRSVLRGDADRVQLLGLDQWIGGVHLQENNQWRWSSEKKELERWTA